MNDKKIQGFARFTKLSSNRSDSFIAWAISHKYRVIPTQEDSELVRLAPQYEGEDIVLYKSNNETPCVHTRDYISHKKLIDHLNHIKPVLIDRTRVYLCNPKEEKRSGFDERSMQILKHCYGVDD